jgi:hypothetical protein
MRKITYVEKLIAKKCVGELLKAGFSISVQDGEEIVLRSSTDKKAIMAALATTDEDRLFTHAPADFEGQRNSFVYLVWGNGCDLIADYGVSLEEVLSKTNAFADKFA